MSVQIRQIKGDIVEFVFNPKEEDLHVGENLSLREKGSGRELIVQVIEFCTVTYPSLLPEMLQLVAGQYCSSAPHVHGDNSPSPDAGSITSGEEAEE